MSLLGRYKKSGGFVQLLYLLESCGKTKREKLLGMIQNESQAWADAIRQRLLSLEKILSWEESARREVLTRIQPLTLAVVLHGMSKEQAETIFEVLSPSLKRRVIDLSEFQKPDKAALAAALNRMVTEVRDLIDHGYLQLKEVDPDLIVPGEIEIQLDYATPKGSVYELASPASVVTSVAISEQIVKATPNDVGALTEENLALRQEISGLKEELARLKKLVAA